jgi:hypothetical protein
MLQLHLRSCVLNAHTTAHHIQKDLTKAYAKEFKKLVIYMGYIHSSNIIVYFIFTL